MSDVENDRRKRKKKGTWDPTNMRKAVENVINNEMSARQAADRYQVPRATLNDRISAIKRGKEMFTEPLMGRFRNTFSLEHEKILVGHVKDLANRLMPLNRKEFLYLVFQLAEKLKLPHQFNKEKKSAGENFYYSFMKRHSDLSLRTPESTSLMRAVGFNRPQVDRFYECLETLIQRFNFTAYKIWNCDETGISIVQKHAKVLATKNQRQVGKLTSAERGKNVTVLIAMSAGGQFVPPFFVFPRSRMNERLMINAPNESVGEAQPNGWMNAELFLKWMHLFVKYSDPTAENPVLLILDGHASHKDLDVIEFARKNHIHMLSTIQFF
ncbi:CENP-B N-terminal DNA-binding domain [Popillia japonica]|uniref:CENP-B N-terminal DNA-binding domain n=1 Tax=Popillia japonica TaxID=7064 RepID=A0AAW1L4G4_POPJA